MVYIRKSVLNAYIREKTDKTDAYGTILTDEKPPHSEYQNVGVVLQIHHLLLLETSDVTIILYHNHKIQVRIK